MSKRNSLYHRAGQRKRVTYNEQKKKSLARHGCTVYPGSNLHCYDGIILQQSNEITATIHYPLSTTNSKSSYEQHKSFDSEKLRASNYIFSQCCNCYSRQFDEHQDVDVVTRRIYFEHISTLLCVRTENMTPNMSNIHSFEMVRNHTMK